MRLIRSDCHVLTINVIFLRMALVAMCMVIIEYANVKYHI